MRACVQDKSFDLFETTRNMSWPCLLQVVVTQATAAAIQAARREGRPLWRVSSTVFSHIASDLTLRPLGRFADDEAVRQYTDVPAGQFVLHELQRIFVVAPHHLD